MKQFLLKTFFIKRLFKKNSGRNRSVNKTVNKKPFMKDTHVLLLSLIALICSAVSLNFSLNQLVNGD